MLCRQHQRVLLLTSPGEHLQMQQDHTWKIRIKLTYTGIDHERKKIKPIYNLTWEVLSFEVLLISDFSSLEYNQFLSPYWIQVIQMNNGSHKSENCILRKLGSLHYRAKENEKHFGNESLHLFFLTYSWKLLKKCANYKPNSAVAEQIR